MIIDRKKIQELGAAVKAWISRNRIAAAAFGAGVLLLLLAGEIGKSDTEEPAPSGETPAVIAADFSLEEEETRIERVLSQIDGVGKVKVVLTLKTGTEQILASNEESTLKTSEKDSVKEYELDSTESIVTVSDSGAGDKVVILKYIYPEYKGALVVAEGAGDAGIKLSLTEAMRSLTGLGSDKITITKMKE